MKKFYMFSIAWNILSYCAWKREGEGSDPLIGLIMRPGIKENVDSYLESLEDGEESIARYYIFKRVRVRGNSSVFTQERQLR